MTCRFLAIAALFASSACAGPRLNPTGSGSESLASRPGALAVSATPADTTSILKRLTKDVVIGSTIDSGNGDKGPRSVSVVPGSHGMLQKGQLLVCNFSDKSGVAGAGTTMEVLDPTAGSKPTRFVADPSIKGCDGDAITRSYDVYGAGFAGAAVVEFDEDGTKIRTYSGSLFKVPFSDVSADPLAPYSPAYVYVSNAESGSIDSISVGFYGTGNAMQVANGFAVSGSGPGDELGPSGLQYNAYVDSLYIVDGVTNTLVAFLHASNLLERDEIIVKRGGKTFECKHAKTTCGKLIYGGSPLNAPLASALLPNGNLIVANTKGTANELVELTPAGQILDTKVVDKSHTQGVFGLAATGTNDSNAALFYTDTNTNNLHELEQ
ncbi:MAG: hypothetical protein WB526_07185 [Candidatus Cybelea sp.]